MTKNPLAGVSGDVGAWMTQAEAWRQEAVKAEAERDIEDIPPMGPKSVRHGVWVARERYDELLAAEAERDRLTKELAIATDLIKRNVGVLAESLKADLAALAALGGKET